MGKSAHRHVIGTVEVGEEVRPAIGIGCSEIGADQTHAIHAVKRKLINVDEIGRNQTDEDIKNSQPENVSAGVAERLNPCRP